MSFAEDEAPPAKPPRPLSPQQQAEHTLIEAFPSIDAKVVKAVLSASGGWVEPAFNALLGKDERKKLSWQGSADSGQGMSDPDFQEEAPPPQPPRPTAQQRQLEQDELYARQLAQQYSGGGQTNRGGHGQEHGNPPLPRRRPQQDSLYTDDRDEPERSFFDGMTTHLFFSH